MQEPQLRADRICQRALVRHVLVRAAAGSSERIQSPALRPGPNPQRRHSRATAKPFGQLHQLVESADAAGGIPVRQENHVARQTLPASARERLHQRRAVIRRATDLDAFEPPRESVPALRPTHLRGRKEGEELVVEGERRKERARRHRADQHLKRRQGLAEGCSAHAARAVEGDDHVAGAARRSARADLYPEASARSVRRDRPLLRANTDVEGGHAGGCVLHRLG